MANINRSMDVSEQQEDLSLKVQESSTGVRYFAQHIARPMQIQSAKHICLGLSGTPTVKLAIDRFVVGGGLTSIDITAALTQVALGTSGVQSFVLPAAGSSLLELQKGDVLSAVTAGTNAAVAQMEINVVVKNLQDIKSWY